MYPHHDPHVCAWRILTWKGKGSRALWTAAPFLNTVRKCNEANVGDASQIMDDLPRNLDIALRLEELGQRGLRAYKSIIDYDRIELGMLAVRLGVLEGRPRTQQVLDVPVSMYIVPDYLRERLGGLTFVPSQASTVHLATRLQGSDWVPRAVLCCSNIRPAGESHESDYLPSGDLWPEVGSPIHDEVTCPACRSMWEHGRVLPGIDAWRDAWPASFGRS